MPSPEREPTVELPDTTPVNSSRFDQLASNLWALLKDPGTVPFESGD